MSKAKIQRKSTAIDMTPMVDLAFLLITFFMLTVKFRPTESVEVQTPKSTADASVPPTDIMIITLAKDGRVFFAVDSKHVRMNMLQKMADRYDLSFDAEETNSFGVQPDVGVPVAYMKQWLAMNVEDRKRNAKGVPCDSTQNELGDWIVAARLSNPKLRIALKGDEDVPYATVKQVINTLQKKDINKFNMITQAESIPTDIPK